MIVVITSIFSSLLSAAHWRTGVMMMIRGGGGHHEAVINAGRQRSVHTRHIIINIRPDGSCQFFQIFRRMSIRGGIIAV